MEEIKMFIIDDHEVFASLLAEKLNQETNIEIVKIFTTMNNLYKAVEQLHPDLLLMDIRVGEDDGLGWTKKLKERFPKIKIILMSGFSIGNYVQSSGADAFFSKEHSFRLLINTIHEVCNKDKTLFYIQKDNDLTGAQLPVLRLLAKGLTNKEIGKKLSLSERTVNNHIADIYFRLDINSKAEAAVKAAKMGLV